MFRLKLKKEGKMRRFALFAFFLLLALPALACGGTAPTGWEGQVKLPASKSHPEVLQASEHIWMPTAVAATATAAAQPQVVPTPTLEPTTASPLTYTVQEGDTLLGVMGRVEWLPGSNCTLQMTQEINGITDPNTIWVGQVITYPSHCRLAATPTN